jgi:signal transduction histidine kinase
MTNDLINQLPGGVVLINEAGLITMINSTAEQHLGYASGQLIEQSFSRLLTVAGRLFYQTHFYPLVNLHGRVDEVSLTLVSRTGKRVPVLLNALRQQQDDGWHIYCVYLPLIQRHHFETELIQARKAAEQAQIAVQERETQYRSLATQLEERVLERTNELTQANAQLIHLNADLKRSNDNLQKFAYVASHDLQEPLRKIQSFADLLKNRYADSLGEGIGFLDRMQSAASRMSTLIRDLLSYSRIATQQDTNSWVVLNTVLDGVVSDLDLRIQETGAQVLIDALPTIQGDPSQLGQLFLNLLSNALKFRRADTTPRIQVRCQTIDSRHLPPQVKPTRVANAYYQIDVSDNGIGFEQKYVDRIFQVFQRLHTKGTFSGTGVGLAICEKVAANHGGAITATSQPEQGTTFSVYLPH